MSESLELLAPPDPAAWDSLVAESADATAFHPSAWGRLWEAEWPGARWQALVLREGQRYAAALGFLVRPTAAGRRIFSMPDGTYGGPLVRSGRNDAPLLERRLLEEYARLAGAGGVLVSQLTWRGRTEPLPGLEAHEGFTQSIALGAGLDPTLAHLPLTVRSRVRQAEAGGLSLRAATGSADVRVYHELVVGNARRHGSQPRPLSLYLRVFEHLVPAGLARFDLVEHEGRVIGGSLHVLHGGHAFNWLTVAHEEHRALRPNHFVLSRWLRGLTQAGYREYDLGSSPQDAQGLIEFKESWGAERLPVLTLRRRSLLHRVLRP